MRVHSLSMSRSQNLALLPRCSSISVSRSSKPAAFPAFNRLRPVASSSRLKGLVSSVGGWLLLGTIVLWCSPGGLRCSNFHSSSIRQKLVSDLVSSDSSDRGRGDIVCPTTTDGCPCFFAVHGEVGVFHHVSPDLTSFIRDFIQVYLSKTAMAG